MKKLFLLVFIVVLFTTALYSQDNFDYSKFNGISLGGGMSIASDISGGLIDFGFSFYSKDTAKGNFSIRNNIEILGGGTSDYGVLGFRERIIFGGIIPITDKFAVRDYGGIDFGVSFYGRDKFFDTPLVLEARGFGGIEFLFSDTSGSVSSSAFIEAGGGARFTTKGGLPAGISGSTVFINVGGRIYF